MDKIEVKVLHEAHSCPAGMMMFLAKLTQRGHNIKNMEDLMKLYTESLHKHKTAQDVVAMPHGTIKRFTPITIAIVGASRRFLAQARTHQVAFNYVSASLQYSDYSGESDFVVPYALFDKPEVKNEYMMSCFNSMEAYEEIAKATDNDTAGYAAPQGLRNILIMQANHESWMTFIRLRGCNRNTVETQFVTMLIWEALLATEDGAEMFHFAGPDCCFGQCREGKMSCGHYLHDVPTDLIMYEMDCSLPHAVVRSKWPLVSGK